MLTATSDPVAPPWPDIVIAGGRKAIGIARYIRKVSMGRTFVCIVQHPRVRFDHFDLVAVPLHDVTNVIAAHAAISRPHEVPACAGTTIVTNGAPNRITPGWLDAAREKWRDILAPLPSPRTAVLIGGNSKHHRLSAATMARLITHLKELHATRGGSLMITVSRRTPMDLREKLAAAFPSPLVREGPAATFVYTGTGENPYAGFLAYADYIIVTTDSTSMMSDAATVGKPIEFFPLPGGSRRNDKFLAHCHDLGVGIMGGTYEPWRDATLVADQIQKMIEKRPDIIPGVGQDRDLKHHKTAANLERHIKEL